MWMLVCTVANAVLGREGVFWKHRGKQVREYWSMIVQTAPGGSALETAERKSGQQMASYLVTGLKKRNKASLCMLPDLS